MLGRVLAALDRVAFEPGTLPAGTITAIAVAPSVAAGLVFFRIRALEGLLIALAVGIALHVLAARLKRPPRASPELAAVIGVALCGPASPPSLLATIALLAGLLELARAKTLPGLHAQGGLIAFGAVFLASRGAVSGYLNPGGLHPLSEPVRLWAAYGAGGTAPIDPVRMYVGNVPGPLFATSLLAVVIGLAWFWYARRLSLVVLLAFAAGSGVMIADQGWNPTFHLDSGPTWFVVGLLLADRAALPDTRPARPLLGLSAGLVAMALRARGLGIESLFLVIAALQLLLATFEGARQVITHRGGVAVWVRGVRNGASVRISRRRSAA